MPPKSIAKEQPASEEEEEVLKAVVLADSFNSRFGPLTVDLPRCLLPVCNAPLLDWTFEALATAGVQEIFVFCGSHVGLIKDAINASRWSRPNSGLKITPIFSREARSVGDAMRELDAKQIMSSDFVLVTGDVVSNVRIDEVVRQHKERRKASKDPIMTMVMREVGPRDRPKPGFDATVIALDAETSQCVHYDYIRNGKGTFQIPSDVLKSHPDLDVRIDLLDCSVDICTPDVPALFTENFDYQELRTDFVKGVLTSDLLTKTIYCYVTESGYGARVKNTKAYGHVSKDIICRRTFPLVPDDNHPSGDAYELRTGLIYVAKQDVLLSRTCTIERHSMIGPKTEVRDEARITASVIGRSCDIGRQSIITDSYIWDNTKIGSGCSIQESIIGSGAVILDGTRVLRGCLIGKGVVLGPEATLRPFSKVTKTKPSQSDENWSDEDGESETSKHGDESDHVALDAALIPVLGPRSKAYLWDEGDNGGSEDDDEIETSQNLKLGRLGDKGSDIEIIESAASEMETDHESSDFGSPRSIASGTSSTMNEPIAALSLDSSSDFLSECKQSLERAYEEGHTIENATIELKTLRMASNVPLRQVAECIVQFLVSKVVLSDEAGANREAVNQMNERWSPLLSSIGWDDPPEAIFMLQRYCALNPAYQKTFGLILAAWYNEDIIEFDDIKTWYSKVLQMKKSGLNAGDPLAATIDDSMQQAAKLIQHIHALEQEDESDEDEEEGGESE